MNARNTGYNFTTQSKTVQGMSHSKAVTGYGRCTYMESNEKVSLHYKSREEDRDWLRDSFTSRLNDKFSWKDHAVKIEQECGSALKLTDMGNQLILIQSMTEDSTKKVISKFDEWTSFWLD